MERKTVGMSARKRSQLSLCDKLQILADVDSKVDRRDICAKFKCGKSTISTILANRSKLAAAAENSAKDRKRQRRNKFPELDSALFQWIKFQQDANVPINGPILLDTANVLANALHIRLEAGEIKSGWIDRFKARHGITFKDVAGEPVVAVAGITPVDNWLQSTWPVVSASYKPETIYSALEFGLYYKMLPDGISSCVEERCAEGEMANERITVLVCSNADGTDRRRLLVVGKPECPTGFKKINLANLPVDYAGNVKSWITAEMFVNWLKDWNRDLHKKDKKILLLVNNCNAHSQCRKMTNIKVVFLPTNSANVQNPLELEIVHSLKYHYRKRIVQKLIMSKEAKQDFKLTMQDVVFYLRNAWDNVTNAAIADGFKELNIENTDPEIIEEVSIMHMSEVSREIQLRELANKFGLEVPSGITMDSYVAADDDLYTSALQDDTTASSAKGEEKIVEESGDEGNEAELVIPTHQKALSYLEGLRTWVVTNTDAEFCEQTCRYFSRLDTRVCNVNSIAQLHPPYATVDAPSNKNPP